MRWGRGGGHFFCLNFPQVGDIRSAEGGVAPKGLGLFGGFEAADLHGRICGADGDAGAVALDAEAVGTGAGEVELGEVPHVVSGSGKGCLLENLVLIVA